MRSKVKFIYDVCKCGNQKLFTADTCQDCYNKSIKAQESYCECGNKKWKSSKRCYECKLKEEIKVGRYYWTYHDFCKCGKVKSKEVERCRSCFYEEKRAWRKDPKCRECNIPLNNDNWYPSSQISGERMCKKCRQKYHHDLFANNYRDKLKDERVALKQEIINAYGGKCKCCSEDNIAFLTIDHIQGDGAFHRRSMPGINLYKWLKKNNFPDGFQCLCMNCNFAKGHDSVCPHEIARREAGQGTQIA